MAAAKRPQVHVWIQENRKTILSCNLLVSIPNTREQIWLEQCILAKVGEGSLIVWNGAEEIHWREGETIPRNSQAY